MAENIDAYALASQVEQFFDSQDSEPVDEKLDVSMMTAAAAEEKKQSDQKIKDAAKELQADFNGLKIVVTGVFKTFERETLEEVIK